MDLLFTSELTDKQYEARLRNYAKGLGFTAQKSRCRVASAPEWQTWQLVDTASGLLAASGLHGGYGLSREEVGKWLDQLVYGIQDLHDDLAELEALQ